MLTAPESYKVIGLMSGTSLDGLDIAYCHFENKGGIWKFSIEKTADIQYTARFKEKLKNTVQLNTIDLLAFHNEYGSWLGDKAADFIAKNKLDVDFISSHGHTVFHQPEIGVTYQIGSGQHVANRSKKKVICDFRTNDVALGGQGAPLVPIGDQLLFGIYDFCLNLGGISNISFQSNHTRIAYDIAPVNMILNYLCQKIDLAYDKGGNLASSGIVNTDLLNKLNGLEYYKKTFPKSLGYEWFLEKIIPLIEKADDSIENLLHTSVHHITDQIAKSVKEIKKENTLLLITGGGAKNDFLIKMLQQKVKQTVNVVIPEEKIIDFKEALIFAFMGVLKERKEINCLHTVTGAEKDSSSGVIYYPS
ncbi:anhydro-N-acetylmuramic acid kinase [Aquimarina sp. RZ0]|nr:anhydro-N-acetylmuramic acid kinase [Aquimarina sp. RZ0]